MLFSFLSRTWGQGGIGVYLFLSGTTPGNDRIASFIGGTFAVQTRGADVDFVFLTVDINPCRERKNRTIPTGGYAREFSQFCLFHTSHSKCTKARIAKFSNIELYGHTGFDPVPTAFVLCT